MRQSKLLTGVVVILLLIIGLITITSYALLNKDSKQFYDDGFYVGVTYCGGSVQEAKELIDKVKDYTNLFTLQAGALQNTAIIEEIGDYAIASKLNYAVYRSAANYDPTVNFNEWVNTAKERWGEHFIGVYFSDEPGGRMLDQNVYFRSAFTGAVAVDEIILTGKNTDGTIQWNANNTAFTYHPDGRITTSAFSEFVYYPDGTFVLSNRGNFYTAENITEYIPQLSYEKLLKQNPLQNHDDAAKAFVNSTKNMIFGVMNKTQLNEESILVFTSDYGLYWWDYQSGYDFILAQLGWNHSVTQEIGLVRGAANLQGKSWGTMITWKYNQMPYLPDGEEMFEQMKASYEAGAEYVIIFNYSENSTDPNILREEHFQALERFWSDVVQNPEVTHGGIKAEAALVLPQNYGWGMRNPQDNIWGIWPADSASQKIWNQIENKIDQYGLKLDIVFEDPNYPATEKYDYIYYWNQR
ncbi:MAG: hypothetical protein FWG55_09605 [Candidatus Bathyarchaeota archaeon]|nr:hypothetical protein [Candidatus Termiticorpusculum sp.]